MMQIAWIALLLVAAPMPDEGRLVFSGSAELVYPGLVSTSNSEIKLTFSPDARRMLWGTIGWDGGAGGWDIWESRLEGGQWSRPAPVSFNSSQNDFDPFFTPDGRGVYFFSNRDGGLGGDDIWFAAFDPETGTYSPAENLGPNINSKGDEWAPILSSDGKRLLFASDGRGGRGLHDLFTSDRKDDTWLPAVPLPGAVSSAEDDFDAILLEKDCLLIFTRKASDKDEAYLYASLLQGGVWSQPVRLGPEVNVDGAWNLGPGANPTEPGMLYFTSHRPGNAVGRSDIYRIPFRVVNEKVVPDPVQSVPHE